MFGPLLVWCSLRTGFGPDFPDSVNSAGGGRSSVEAWYTAALDTEEVLSGAVDSDIHLCVADVSKSFDTVDRCVLGRVLSSLACLIGSVMSTLSIMRMSGCGLSLLLVLVGHGLVVGAFLRAAH